MKANLTLTRGTAGLMAAALASFTLHAAGMTPQGGRAQRGKPPSTISATVTYDNAIGDQIAIDNSTLPASGILQIGGDYGEAGQFLFSLPGSGKNKRYLNFKYPSTAFVTTPCDPPSFSTNPSGPAGVNVYGAWVAFRSLTHLQIGEARAVTTHYGASGGQFLWMGETNVVHSCTNFAAAYRVDQRTWRVATTLDRLSIPDDGEYHGVIGGQIYDGGCRRLTGCLTPTLVTPGGLTVIEGETGFDRHYTMPWGVTIYCETCAPPPSCATWPTPGQPCQFWLN